MKTTDEPGKRNVKSGSNLRKKEHSAMARGPAQSQSQARDQVPLLAAQQATNESPSDEKDPQLSALANALWFVVNEPLLLAQNELTVQRKLPILQPEVGPTRATFMKRVDEVLEHLGAPPKFYLVRKGEDHLIPAADTYPVAAMNEIFEVFHRTRTSVLRARVYAAGAAVLEANSFKVFEHLHTRQEQQELYVRVSQAAVWEHAEAAYIRIYSFWDRVGQILDFAFFNIRKFDHNGFNSVMDRIHSNIAPMNNELANSQSWQRLRRFQNSRNDDGLKWLLERRNLIVHSLHLHPLQDSEDGVFKSQFNHLDVAHRDKLKPRTPDEEIEMLMGHIAKAVMLFSDVLTLLGYSNSRKKTAFI